MRVRNSWNSAGVIFEAKRRWTIGRSVPEALLMTWRSFLSSPWTSLMTWMVPFGSVRTAASRAISAVAESTSGNRPARVRRVISS